MQLPYATFGDIVLSIRFSVRPPNTIIKAPTKAKAMVGGATAAIISAKAMINISSAFSHGEFLLAINSLPSINALIL
jgi:hypothetical protein